jgi:plasmid stability protein
MGVITVRKLTDEEIRDLRLSAAKRGVSMEQEARDRLRRPLPSATGSTPRLDDADQQARLDEILAFGRRLPKVEFDSKRASDELYDYLDEK